MEAVGLCLDYDAHVEIHALDPPAEQVLRQNSQREAAVPAAVIDRLVAKWEPPSLVEPHNVEWVA